MIRDGQFYLRRPDLLVVGTRSGYLLVGDDGTFELTTASTTMWRALWQRLMRPTAGAELSATLAGQPEHERANVAALIAGGQLLCACNATSLATCHARAMVDNQGFHLQPREPACTTLVLACTGSIVAGLMPPVVLSLCYSRFQQQLELVLTPSALRFVTRELFEHYGVRTWVDISERRDGIDVAHVALGASADCLLVMPATAASLYRLAHATCEDLLSLTAAASTAPVVLAPAMNATMWNHPAVQRNVAQLRADGAYVIEPTNIVGAADLSRGGEPMYGGPGSLWRGPRGLMQAVEAVLAHASRAHPAAASAVTTSP